jgi:2-octaprenyl-6-methoxyphenol hydroxylase
MARAFLSSVPETVDVLIAGGGYVGLSLALALKVGAKDLTVAVVDLREPEQADKDGRASAIASAARTMLTTLGAWQGLPKRRSRSTR